MNAVTAVRALGSFGQQVRAVSSHVEEVIRLIAANIGIGMLPDHLAGPWVTEGKLWQLPPYDVLPTCDVFRITSPNSILNPAEHAFLAHVADTPVLDHSAGAP
jgi:DNA-binding transcriptional LysR family regulator